MRCEECWQEAQLRYANGQSQYESLTAAYYAVMEQREREHAPCTQRNQPVTLDEEAQP